MYCIESGSLLIAAGHRHGRNNASAPFIDDYFVPESDRIGEEREGFKFILRSLTPERILVGIEAVGLGRGALARAADYPELAELKRDVFATGDCVRAS